MMTKTPGSFWPLPDMVMKLALSVLALLMLSVHQVESREAAREELAFTEMDDVFAAAKHLQEIKDAPASVTVVTDEDIQKYGYRNLSDVLRNVTGFYTSSDRNYEYVGFRGITRLGDHGNLLLELVDGHTYNDNVYGSFFMGNEFGIDIDLIKKVEVVRGPGSALYGSNALLGVVNVITKRGEDIKGLYTKVEAGSYDTYKGGFIYGDRLENGLDLILSVSAVGSEGQDFSIKELGLPARRNGRVVGADGEEAWSGFLKAVYHELSFTASANTREKNVPTGAFGTIIGDNRFETTDTTSFVEAKWEHPLGAENEVVARAYYDGYSYLADYPFADNPVLINRDESIGHWVGSELRYFQRIAASHLITIGGEVVHHIEASQTNFDVEPHAVFLIDNHSFSTWSLYAQDEWDIFTWLRFVAGARYDYYTAFGQHLSPRVGWILKPADETTLKLLYGQSFRSPSVFELFYDDGESTAKANPDLKSEILDAYELVWEQELSPIWKTVVSAFHYDIRDLIIPVDVGSNVVQFQNLDGAKSDGIEGGLEANWPGLFRGGISYTYQRAMNEETGQRLPNSPRHLVNLKGTFPIYKDRAFLGVSCRYMSERLTRSEDELDGAFVTDIQLYLPHIYKRLDISLGVFNLLDEKYFDPVSADHRQQSIEQNGRNFWLKAAYRF